MSRKSIGAALVLILVLITSLLPACTKTVPATAYTAIIPAVLQSGVAQNVSISLFTNNSKASGNVIVSLINENKTVAEAQNRIDGTGKIELNVPNLPEGEYTLKVKGESFQDETKVKVNNTPLVFLETDKPIYKPGQTIHMRSMTLDSGLLPVTDNITIDVLDAKGIKIFRAQTTSDDYGIATTDLPISNEPNLGTWKITASTSKSTTQADIRVEEYVLPKYEVKVDLPKEWYLVNESIKGKVSATYSFGKPVKGDLQIIATKYVGKWQEYARITQTIDGDADFTIPPANYVAGVPAAQGNGNVKLHCIVTEASTGYEETSDTLMTVSQSSTNISIIPSGSTFKPGLPYKLLIVSETPDNKLIEADLNLHVSYTDATYKEIKSFDQKVRTEKGKYLLEISPPQGSIALNINCSTANTSVNKTIEAAYSPTGNFIHVEQTSEGTASPGEDVKFYVFSTGEAANFYYEVISRGRLVFSSYTKNNEIVLKATPAMSPSSKLLVYQILPNAEVAADYLPFAVSAQYPQNVTLEPSTNEAKPGDNIAINVQTEGQSEVGLAAVDKSVFILAENRLNLQQVFDQLEKLYMNPQAELHAVSMSDGIQNRGAKETFQDAGVIVLSNKDIPEGKKYQAPVRLMLGARPPGGAEKAAAPAATTPAPTTMPAPAPVVQAPSADSGLAEVQRVRQYFPETWIWDKIVTDSSGKASFKVSVPDTITTWMMRAVAISKSKGLGIAENQLKVFQPFFLSIDLPYSAIRGEEFPVSVAVYNYLDKTQSVVVQIEPADWYQLLDNSEQTLEIKANDIGSTKFKIKPVKLGNACAIKVTARSSAAADAVIKTLIIEAEGVARETVNNVTLTDGQTTQLDSDIPDLSVEGSARVYFAVTSSFLAQTIDGLESLIQMPFGCGEQNMIIFAPDVYITKYLQSSGQLKPEIMAKAEKLMLTGYQRELTYRRQDGSFSAFGESDESGSLWLTAFVLKCLSEAKGLIYIDDQVLDRASQWILSHQNSDGSFDQVGFVHHQEMLGGLKGKTALTAYVAIALLQAGEKTGSQKAVAYLEKQIDTTEDAYTTALAAYALELAGSQDKQTAHDKLMSLAKQDENGLYWGDTAVIAPNSGDGFGGIKRMPGRPGVQTSTIETTAYATLALTKNGDAFNAASAARWLVSKRNASGGFGSTQDTVMALQALIEYSGKSRADVNLTVKVDAGEKTQNLKIDSANYDVLQIIEIPVNSSVKISASGNGQAIGQIVKRYNLPQAEQQKNDALKINVSYDADEVEVNDQVNVAVGLSFNPPEPIEAGMLVVDISVPTGFAAVKESIEKAVSQQNKLKRFDISGRKVIFYVENMLAGQSLSFNFQVQALYPVKAKGSSSLAYSYYQPEISAESLGKDITILGQ